MRNFVLDNLENSDLTMAFIYRIPPFLFSIIVVLTVLYLTLMPDPLPETDIPMFEGADKIVHAIMMAGVCLAVALDMIRRNRQRFRLSVPACVCMFVAVTAFGGCIEITQDAMNMGRGGDWMDFAADATGALLGCVITLYFPWRRLLTGGDRRPAGHD